MQQLHAVGITRVVSPGNGGMVRLETGYGAVYVRYPAGVPQTAFDQVVGPGVIPAKADVARALESLAPEAAQVTAANNRLEWLRANPWH
jgi:hypothetical protein